MKVVNYNRNQIAKQIDVLTREMQEEKNFEHQQHTKNTRIRMIVAGALNLLSVITMVIMLISNMSKVTLISTEIALIAMLAASITLIVLTVIGKPKLVDVMSKKTFAMNFYEVEQAGRIISIVPQKGKHIVVTYEVNHHIHTKNLIVNQAIKTTNVQELQLDVGRGYLLIPFHEESSVEFEEEIVIEKIDPNIL